MVWSWIKCRQKTNFQCVKFINSCEWKWLSLEAEHQQHRKFSMGYEKNVLITTIALARDGTRVVQVICRNRSNFSKPYFSALNFLNSPSEEKKHFLWRSYRVKTNQKVIYRGLYSYPQWLSLITLFPNNHFLLLQHVERVCKSFWNENLTLTSSSFA